MDGSTEQSPRSPVHDQDNLYWPEDTYEWVGLLGKLGSLGEVPWKVWVSYLLCHAACRNRPAQPVRRGGLARKA